MQLAQRVNDLWLSTLGVEPQDLDASDMEFVRDTSLPITCKKLSEVFHILREVQFKSNTYVELMYPDVDVLPLTENARYQRVVERKKKELKVPGTPVVVPWMLQYLQERYVSWDWFHRRCVESLIRYADEISNPDTQSPVLTNTTCLVYMSGNSTTFDTSVSVIDMIEVGAIRSKYIATDLDWKFGEKQVTIPVTDGYYEFSSKFQSALDLVTAERLDGLRMTGKNGIFVIKNLQREKVMAQKELLIKIIQFFGTVTSVRWFVDDELKNPQEVTRIPQQKTIKKQQKVEVKPQVPTPVNSSKRKRRLGQVSRSSKSSGTSRSSRRGPRVGLSTNKLRRTSLLQRMKQVAKQKISSAARTIARRAGQTVSNVTQFTKRTARSIARASMHAVDTVSNGFVQIGEHVGRVTSGAYSMFKEWKGDPTPLDAKPQKNDFQWSQINSKSIYTGIQALYDDGRSLLFLFVENFAAIQSKLTVVDPYTEPDFVPIPLQWNATFTPTQYDTTHHVFLLGHVHFDNNLGDPTKYSIDEDRMDLKSTALADIWDMHLTTCPKNSPIVESVSQSFGKYDAESDAENE
jgi:hypothetical protein